MLKNGKIDRNWDIEEIKNLPYKFDYHKDLDLIKMYASLGHNEDSMIIYNCFEDEINLNLNYYKNSFSFLNNISLAVNLFKPGQYLPLHVDLYQRYKKIHNLDDNVKIFRIVVMLEDSVPGQILQIENNLIGNWQAGEWFGWVNCESHAFYNLSTVDRYAIQVTGTIN
jgi:hypothetical protein